MPDVYDGVLPSRNGAAPRVRSGGENPENPAHRKRVLLIEDDEIVLECMTLLLQHEYDVIAADNGSDGIALAQSGHPDLVLSDLNMEGFDGLAVARTLRQDMRTSALPFVLITATPEAGLKHQCQALGVSELVRKPFDPDALMGLVARLLAARPMEESLT